MMYEVKRFRFVCDGCGRLALVEGLDNEGPRLPIGWIHFTGLNSGRERHYCHGCARERRLIRDE